MEFFAVITKKLIIKQLESPTFIQKKNQKVFCFTLTEHDFEKPEIKENDKICWQKWHSIENTNLKKSSE